MKRLLDQFIATFQKAIRTEMDAMQKQMGPFEVSLANGQLVDSSSTEQAKRYRFEVLKPNDKLVLQAECTLTYDGGQTLVTIDALDQDTITLKSARTIPLEHHTYALVIYPWFLYERLLEALDDLPDADQRYLEHAFRLFGKQSANFASTSLNLPHTELNQSQQAAIQLCANSDLAFVWGPPGTGKTTTLGHIVTELLSQGHRILLTSTTNAAVDQALAKLSTLEVADTYFQQGEIVRIGQSSAETFGTSLYQVVNRLNQVKINKMRKLNTRLQQVERQIALCQSLLDKLADARQPIQLDLFQVQKSSGLMAQDLATIFSAKRIDRLLYDDAEAQARQISHRQDRLQTVQILAQEAVNQLRQDLRYQEQMVIKQAKVILSTMTNTYMSGFINSERFDVVIVEEAGMAILPTLFYCATLAKSKVIIVGDPQQLPPIVQSRAEFVHKAMGRNIFSVTVPDPYAADTVIMLDTQYRMHPTIGNLVSTLFYSDKLQHGTETQDRTAIAAKSPHPEEPLVILDTAGQTTCATREGNFSRFNEKNGQLCLDLALDAVRNGIESVAIITPYVAQSRLIRQAIARFTREAAHIECHTVHRFQGNERDLVIFDTVDTAPFSPGVLLSGTGSMSSASNLINVSLSRARGKLIIVADVAYFQKRAADGMLSLVLKEAMNAGMQVSV
ncbi:MAG: AAA domain-containing protein [Chloroflexota bacterium]